MPYKKKNSQSSTLDLKKKKSNKPLPEKTSVLH